MGTGGHGRPAQHQKPLKRRGSVFASLRYSRLAWVLSVAGVASADNAGAADRKLTHIGAQDLGPALKQLAQSRGLQVLYLSNTVRDVHTHGADGEITANEAFNQLLDGTGLTYRYLDEKTVTVVPLDNSSLSDRTGASRAAPSGNAIAADSPRRAAKASASDAELRLRRRSRLPHGSRPAHRPTLSRCRKSSSRARASPRRMK